MKPVATSTAVDKKKGHVCPPSDATHPADRWETAFVYAFITKFTQLKGKMEGYESPVDLENALLSPTQHPYLVQILSRFVLNLKPGTRNLNSDQISSTVSSVLQEYMKSSERTLFWNDELKANIDPLQNVEGGFWGADWDLKLRILRQLVELQLSHHAETREMIDRAWGVIHNKHKKKEGNSAPQDAGDSLGMERLSTVPLGQDCQRTRYWAVDDSPRLYVSTNPWKITATFKTASTTKEEYIQIIEDLKKMGPAEPKEGEKRSRLETAHLTLTKVLESRLTVIDAELVRAQKIRRKIEQREFLLAQAEVRETRTRRQTRRPDYVYHHDADTDDDGDYNFQDDDDDEDHIELDEDEFAYDSAGHSARGTRPRRSLRTSTLNANGKRSAPDAQSEWRGERRSSRLGTNPEVRTSRPPTKRARTEERSISTAPSDVPLQVVDQKLPGAPAKKEGAAAVRAHEIALEQVAGKRRSRYWFYAVEPIPQPPGLVSGSTLPTNGEGSSRSNGRYENGGSSRVDEDSLMEQNGNGGAYEGSLSPSSSHGMEVKSG